MVRADSMDKAVKKTYHRTPRVDSLGEVFYVDDAPKIFIRPTYSSSRTWRTRCEHLLDSYFGFGVEATR